MVDQTIDDLLAISCVDTDTNANNNNNASQPSSEILETQTNLLRPIEQQPTPGLAVLFYMCNLIIDVLFKGGPGPVRNMCLNYAQ